MFKKLASLLPAVAILAADPVMAVNVGLGAAAKHKTKVKNGTIPFINLGLSVAGCYMKSALTTGDWAGSVVPALTEGVQLAGGSTLLHQAIKIPVRHITNCDGSGGVSV